MNPSHLFKIIILNCIILIIWLLGIPLVSFSSQEVVRFGLIQAKGIVNREEIGGEELNIVSIWDDKPAPVAGDGSFVTKISNQRPQKVSLIDSKKKTRALAILLPQYCANIVFDAKSTAAAVLFYAPSSFGQSIQVENFLKCLETKASFRDLVLFFKKNLRLSPLEALTKDEEYAGILEKCNSEIFGQNMKAIGSSLQAAQEELEKTLQF